MGTTCKTNWPNQTIESGKERVFAAKGVCCFDPIATIDGQKVELVPGFSSELCRYAEIDIHKTKDEKFIASVIRLSS